MQNNTIMSTTAVPMRLVYSTEGTAVYKPVVLSSAPQSAAAGTPGAAAAAAPPAGGGRGSAGEPSKRKRGRPRKYGPDGSMVLAVMPVSPAAVPPPSGGGTPVVPAAVPPPSGGGMPVAPAAVPPPSGGGTPITLAAAPPPPPSGGGAPVAPAVAQPPSGGGTPISPAVVLQPSGAGRTSGGFPSVMSLPAVLPKKGKGRPVGSVNKQPVTAFGSSGFGITPYIITVNAGEDVSSKIMSFPQQGPKGICILSANGAVSNVTLRQASTSGGTVTYEGRFEILSLSGSFLLSESGGQRSRTGGLSISLAGPDGRVLGGGVAGLLTAASPVQVVIGSFIVSGQNEVKATNASDTSAAPKITPVGAPVSSSPPSRGTPSESSDGPGSPPYQSTGTCNNSAHQGVIHMPWK